MKKLTPTNFLCFSIWKKSFLAALFPLMALTLATSQVSFGVKAGPTFSRMGYNGAESLNSFHGGIITGFNIAEKLSLQPELLYSVKGTRIDDPNLDVPFKMEVQFISLPIMISYGITDRLNIKAGPEINFRVGADTPFIMAISDDDVFESTEIAIGGGISYRFLEKLGAEFRYSLGLTEVSKIQFTDVNGESISSPGDGKIQVMQLSVFYLFKG